MKVVKDREENTKFVSFEYSKWPEDGKGIATIYEWENGEGVNIELDGMKIEATNAEITAISTLWLKLLNDSYLK